MRSIILSALLIVWATIGIAQSTKFEQDKAAIKDMCGCYSITFDYAEFFPRDSSYALHEPYHAKADAEWIFVEEETDNKLVIQHILVVNDSVIVKHWRQDWLYENRDLYTYDRDKHWDYTQLPAEAVQGQWTQKVFQVDDSPRYEGNGTWVHVDGQSYWESTTDAPLPRREFSKRSDYNVMARTNRHALTDDGWVHEQDNLKILRSEQGDSVLVEEKGRNVYTRIDDSHCQLAMEWWAENSDYWALVRAEWDALFAQQKDITITPKIEDKVLWQALFALQSEVGETEEEMRAAIQEVLASYVKQGDNDWRSAIE